MLLGLNVGLNLVLIPEFGFLAAAVVSVVTQVVCVVLMGSLAWRRHRLRPNLWYLRPVLVASGAMTVVLLAPLPLLVAAPLALLLYLAILLAARGAVRDVVVRGFFRRTPLGAWGNPWFPHGPLLRLAASSRIGVASRADEPPSGRGTWTSLQGPGSSCGLRARTCGAGAPARNLLSRHMACRDGRDALCPWTGHAAIPPVRLVRGAEDE